MKNEGETIRREMAEELFTDRVLRLGLLSTQSEAVFDAARRARDEAMSPKFGADLADYGAKIIFYVTDQEGREICGTLGIDMAYQLAAAIGARLSRAKYTPKGSD